MRETMTSTMTSTMSETMTATMSDDRGDERSEGAPMRKSSMQTRLPIAATSASRQRRSIAAFGTALLALGGALGLGGCEPELDQRLSVLDAPRVLAVISEPAETRPSTNATHRVWIAGGTGQVTSAVRWAFCTEPKPPTEDNVVNARCLGAAVRELGESQAITADTPADACMRFGPDVASGDYRPRDPDITGGYYQPLRLTLPAEQGAQVAFASHRISCNLANAPVDVVRAYRERYVANGNPPVATLGDAEGRAVTSVRPGERVTLVASWPAGASERYVWFDPPPARLRDRRESLRVSWYITGGALCSDATGQSEAEIDEAAAAAGDREGASPEGSTPNCWEAPAQEGVVTLWLVLRDSRGGASISQHLIQVSSGSVATSGS